MVFGDSSLPTPEGHGALGIPVCWSSGILLCTAVYPSGASILTLPARCSGK
jgi:hypothetical protein